MKEPRTCILPAPCLSECLPESAKQASVRKGIGDVSPQSQRRLLFTFSQLTQKVSGGKFAIPGRGYAALTCRASSLGRHIGSPLIRQRLRPASREPSFAPIRRRFPHRLRRKENPLCGQCNNDARNAQTNSVLFQWLLVRGQSSRHRTTSRSYKRSRDEGVFDEARPVLDAVSHGRAAARARRRLASHARQRVVREARQCRLVDALLARDGLACVLSEHRFRRA